MFSGSHARPGMDSFPPLVPRRLRFVARLANSRKGCVTCDNAGTDYDFESRGRSSVGQSGGLIIRRLPDGGTAETCSTFVPRLVVLTGPFEG